MKIKDKTGVKFKNFTVTVPVQLMPEIERRATEEDITVSAYLRRLLKIDLKELKES